MAIHELLTDYSSGNFLSLNAKLSAKSFWTPAVLEQSNNFFKDLNNFSKSPKLYIGTLRAIVVSVPITPEFGRIFYRILMESLAALKEKKYIQILFARMGDYFFTSVSYSDLVICIKFLYSTHPQNVISMYRGVRKKNHAIGARLLIDTYDFLYFAERLLKNKPDQFAESITDYSSQNDGQIYSDLLFTSRDNLVHEKLRLKANANIMVLNGDYSNIEKCRLSNDLWNYFVLMLSEKQQQHQVETFVKDIDRVILALDNKIPTIFISSDIKYFLNYGSQLVDAVQNQSRGSVNIVYHLSCGSEPPVEYTKIDKLYFVRDESVHKKSPVYYHLIRYLEVYNLACRANLEVLIVDADLVLSGNVIDFFERSRKLSDFRFRLRVGRPDPWNQIDAGFIYANFRSEKVRSFFLTVAQMVQRSLALDKVPWGADQIILYVSYLRNFEQLKDYVNLIQEVDCSHSNPGSYFHGYLSGVQKNVLPDPVDWSKLVAIKA